MRITLPNWLWLTILGVVLFFAVKGLVGQGAEVPEPPPGGPCFEVLNVEATLSGVHEQTYLPKIVLMHDKCQGRAWALDHRAGAFSWEPVEYTGGYER